MGTFLSVTEHHSTATALQHNKIADASNGQLYIEGAARTVEVNRYERNPEARRICIRHYGLSCRVCGFNFQHVYGDRGVEFIHVHHLTPLSTIAEQYELDPIRDLRPVCPNCHAMLHQRTSPLSIQELRSRIEAA
jgi:5-methylcytosine-specific restriction protein A